MAAVFFQVLVFLFSLAVGRVEGANLPHILFVLVDDLGWGDVGFHRAVPTADVATPNIDSLVAQGVNLTRHYVFRMCTPSRTSVQSGRLPVHVNTRLQDPDDPTCGIPKNMTGMASKLKLAGYSTHFVGKWDAGMATPSHTPEGRGYDTSLNYFSHKNNYFTQRDMQSGCLEAGYNITDLWKTNAPAYNLNGTDYEEFLFYNEIESVLTAHDPSTPLMLFYAPHVAHCPLQVPKEYYDEFSFMTDDENACSAQTPYIYPNQTEPYYCRRQYSSMVHLLDDIIGNVTNLFKTLNLWDNTLMVFSADNGGPIDIGESAASNYPLRGGKYSVWEGGVRSTAFASGGFLPEEVRGTSQDGLMHIADWYTTFCALGGVDPFDQLAAESHLPPVDGLDMWPLLSGQNETSPRFELVVDVNCFIQGDLKLVLGSVTDSGYQGPVYPNSTSTQLDPTYTVDCGKGCLYNVSADPTEHNDLAASYPDIVNAMTARLNYLSQSFFNNNDTGVNACPPNVTAECACWMAVNYYGNYFGPYQDFDIALDFVDEN